MSNGAQVTFTRLQLEFLERHFPEIVGSHTTTNDELRFRSGQRTVVAFCRLYEAKEPKR